MEKERVYKNLSAVGIKVDSRPYIYDRYTNHLLKVDDVVYEILDDSLVSTCEEVVEKYSNQFDVDEIEKAYNNIHNMQDKQGLFTPYVIPKLSISSNESAGEKVHQKLQGGLSELVFNVTEDCNLRCRYCIYSGAYEDRRKHNKDNNISLDIAKKAINFFINNSGEKEQLYISFYGGEPLLRFDFIRKVIAYANKKNSELSYSITSNGTLLTPDILDFLSQHKVRLSISLDGPQEIHDANRVFPNNKGTFKIIERNIQLIRDKYPDYYSKYLKINAVLVPHKFGDQALNKFFCTERFSFLSDETKFSVGLVNPTKNNYIPETGYYTYLRELFESLYKKYIESHCQDEPPILPSLESKLFGRKMKLIHYRSHLPMKDYAFFWPNGICLPGMRSVFVSADGSFYPCEKLYDYQDMKIGDINSGFDFDKISQYIEDYIKSVYNICSMCWAFRFCSECFLSLRRKRSNDINLRLWYCQSQKRSIIEHLKMYIRIRSCNPHAFKYLEEDKENASYLDYMIED